MGLPKGNKDISKIWLPILKKVYARISVKDLTDAAGNLLDGKKARNSGLMGF